MTEDVKKDLTSPNQTLYDSGDLSEVLRYAKGLKRAAGGMVAALQRMEKKKQTGT